jgi:xanthine dehydrogenase accessory factor
MRDVLDKLASWRQADEEIAIATVVNTWGSSPRPVGSKLITTRGGGIAGSVSAGCVEGTVIEESKVVMDTGKPRLLTFGVSDEEAWGVGLACGGTIQVFVEPSWALDAVYNSLKQHLEARDPTVVISVIEGAPERLNRKLMVLADGRTEGDLDIPGQSKTLVSAALELLAKETCGVLNLEDGTSLFIEVYLPPPRLIIIGAVHIAQPLISIAKIAGFDTMVIDPRQAFATRERFPHAGDLIQAWPQRVLSGMALDSSAYVVVLTHDPKIDDPTLQIALRSKASYVGALGSRRTHRKRVERLREAGLTEEQISRLHAPIGFDIGGRSPGEIAVSIVAEVIQVRNSILSAKTVKTDDHVQYN